ncbi:MAG: DUF4783 domain-containing protein [Bacteroidia bacterium]|nr:DUF4783 domain-containing protein [Bacteroidia bacterium]
MKLVIRIILTIFVSLTIALSAYTQESNGWKYHLPKECWDAMVGGKPQLVAKYFAPSVELSLPSGSGLYSSKQATVVLQEFVSKSKISNAEIDNERQTGKSIMMIATFEISERPYRVYVLTQNGQIHKLRIEEDK